VVVEAALRGDWGPSSRAGSTTSTTGFARGVELFLEPEEGIELGDSPTGSVEVCRAGAVVGTAAPLSPEYSARPSPTGVNVPARKPAAPRNLAVMQITIVFRSLIQSSGPESTYLQLL